MAVGIRAKQAYDIVSWRERVTRKTAISGFKFSKLNNLYLIMEKKKKFQTKLHLSVSRVRSGGHIVS